jgi:hypothetical protein
VRDGRPVAERAVAPGATDGALLVTEGVGRSRGVARAPARFTSLLTR